MIIDSHAHIGRNEHINASVDELLLSMDKSKIDKALVFAGKINDIDNEFLYKQISGKDRLHGVLACHINDAKYDRDLLRDLLNDPKIVGVKFYLGYEHWYPDNSKIYEVLDYIQYKKKVAIFHCGDCLSSIGNAKLKYAHPLGIDDPAVDFPELKIVIAHIGFPWQQETAEVCYKNKNVYSDISGFVYGDFSFSDKIKFKKVISEFLAICPSNKLLFGTDYPISNQKSYLTALDDSFGELLTPRALSHNTEKVFNI